MNPAFEINESLRELFRQALTEDTGGGDITTLATIHSAQQGRARLYAKADGIFAGQSVFHEIFYLIDPTVRCSWFIKDGDPVQAKRVCAELQGNMRVILIGERTALNFIQRMSGIATLTNSFVKQIQNTRARIIDTRKTTPLWRYLEKYSVTAGGGTNHRMGLYDMFLIKDNHIASAGSLTKAIQCALDYNRNLNPPRSIEVETKNLNEVREALQYPVQRIMLDNMPVPVMAEAVQMVNHQCEVEASGGVTMETVRAIAETGVDYISVGALTHSAPALDLSLLVESSIL